jgi:hypothetical protein
MRCRLIWVLVRCRLIWVLVRCRLIWDALNGASVDIREGLRGQAEFLPLQTTYYKISPVL